jgi:hypothetical protein
VAGESVAGGKQQMRLVWKTGGGARERTLTWTHFEPNNVKVTYRTLWGRGPVRTVSLRRSREDFSLGEVDVIAESDGVSLQQREAIRLQLERRVPKTSGDWYHSRVLPNLWIAAQEDGELTIHLRQLYPMFTQAGFPVDPTGETLFNVAGLLDRTQLLRQLAPGQSVVIGELQDMYALRTHADLVIHNESDR